MKREGTPTLTEFVQRAQAALAEYQRLRFLGVAHEIAIYQSGFYAVIVRPSEAREDGRAKAARNDV